MEQDQQNLPIPEPLLAAWIKWTMDFWEALAQMGPSRARTSVTSAASLQGVKRPPGDFSQLALRMWEAFFSLLSEPRTVDAVFKGIKAPSEITLKMAQTGWEGYFHLHRQWLAGGGEGEALGFEDLDKDTFKIWAEIYERDFKQLLNLPLIGLIRFSQEKISRGMAKFGQYQAAMAEFMYLIYLPMKQSLRVMQEKLEEISRETELSEDFKEYYKMWLKILESRYMILFKSPEYLRTLSYTLDALEDFTLAKQELLADSLKALSLPSLQEMDELYREIYLLKKRVKDLEKILARLEPA